MHYRKIRILITPLAFDIECVNAFYLESILYGVFRKALCPIYIFGASMTQCINFYPPWQLLYKTTQKCGDIFFISKIPYMEP